MLRILMPFLALAAFAAEDPGWDKVKALKPGTEVRVVVAKGAQPLLGSIDEANDERIILVLKNGQQAVDRSDIIRLDARPQASKDSGKVQKTQNVNNDITNPRPPKAINSPYDRPGPSSSSSTNYSWGGKPDYSTVYRKGAPATK